VTIAGAAWAHQSTHRIVARVETVDAGTGGAASASGRVASVDVSERTLTIDMAHTSTDFSSISTGDEVQVQLATDAEDVSTPSADEGQPSTGGSPRRWLGLWLLAMTGTTVVLRARRSLTI